jgi:hypothetical protein
MKKLILAVSVMLLSVIGYAQPEIGHFQQLKTVRRGDTIDVAWYYKPASGVDIRTFQVDFQFKKTLFTHISTTVDAGYSTYSPTINFQKWDNYKYSSYSSSTGTYSYASDNFYLDAIRKLKAEFPEMVIMSDVAMDPYSSDGHDGLVENGEIVNDKTLPILAKMAIAQAQAGVDIIGPSDMMDGRVGYLREELDEAGYENTSIMSYSVKYASAFYNPFRDALDSAPKSGDKKTYQMNPANKREALLEAELDYSEGADMLMVKPALCYLDVIHLLKENFINLIPQKGKSQFGKGHIRLLAYTLIDLRNEYDVLVVDKDKFYHFVREMFLNITKNRGTFVDSDGKTKYWLLDIIRYDDKDSIIAMANETRLYVDMKLKDVDGDIEQFSELNGFSLRQFSRNINKMQRWQVLLNNPICPICGNVVHLGDDVHHIKHYAKGGTNDVLNSVILHNKCHIEHHKNDIPLAIDLDV